MTMYMYVDADVVLPVASTVRVELMQARIGEVVNEQHSSSLLLYVHVLPGRVELARGCR